MKKTEHTEEKEFVISYLTLRRTIGLLGLLLPFILIAGNFFVIKTGLYAQPRYYSPFFGTVTIGHWPVIQDSISDFYYTPLGDVFTSIICAFSLFLFCYKGHDSNDNKLTNIAAVLALGIVCFPTEAAPDLFFSFRTFKSSALTGYIHLGCASAFFFMLALLSWFQFTLSKGERTEQKKWRNRVYRTCAAGMVLCLILIAVYIVGRNKGVPFFLMLQTLKPVIVLESAMLVLFGISWLTKGEVWLKDKQNATPPAIDQK